MQREQMESMLETLFAPWIRELDLQVDSISAEEVCLRLPFTPHLTHVAGVICGQAHMAAADTAMVLAVANALGEFRPMTTVSMNTSFMRPVSAGDVRVTARILRRGKNLVFGEILLADSQGQLAVHATTTYALL